MARRGPVGVGDDDHVVSSCKELQAERVNVKLYAAGHREEKV
jgi:hypothetical protein